MEAKYTAMPTHMTLLRTFEVYIQQNHHPKIYTSMVCNMTLNLGLID